jgi:hypothetical protein
MSATSSGKPGGNVNVNVYLCGERGRSTRHINVNKGQPKQLAMEGRKNRLLPIYDGSPSWTKVGTNGKNVFQCNVIRLTAVSGAVQSLLATAPVH